MVRFRFALMYFISGLVLLWTFCLPLSAQNLVPNPSFEILANCPAQCGQPGGGATEAIPWFSWGSADIFNPCVNPTWCGAPDNFQGHQEAFDGVGYGGGYYDSYSGVQHEFLYTEMLDTLEEDSCYKVSAWINLADEGCGCDQAGILLTPGVPTVFTGAFPQVSWGGGYITDQENWINLLGYHLALGNENYITIGNFVPHNGTNGDPSCWGPPAFCYYYVDYVEVMKVPIEQVTIDLGPPVTACDSFIIDPGGDPDIVYLWNTGHQGHTLTVYTSGVYSVTASRACTMAEGEIEVTIINGEHVDIGPEAILLCEGDAYEISLNPNLGTYEWQDGSTDPEYSITTGGIYMVTLDDGCYLSSDTMEVTMVDVPLAFTLGPDTVLCQGDQFTIGFDPGLGNFTWQDGSDESNYTIDNEGQYALTISNMCGEQSDDLVVTSLLPPSIYLGPDTTFLCGTGFLDIDFDPEMGSYLWNDGSTNPNYTILDPGIYSVTLTNQCGSDMDEMLVVHDEIPEIDLGSDLSGCPGDIFILDPGSFSGTIIWQDGSTTPSYTVTESGTYSVQVSNFCGQDEDTIVAIYYPEITPPDLGPDISLCPGDTYILHADIQGADYLWNDMSTADSLLVTTAGIYFVEAYNACASYSDTIVVQMNSNAPSFQLPPDFALCLGQTIILDPGLSGVNYLWSDGSMMPTLQVSTPGTYALTVSNSCGTSTDTVLISAGTAPPQVDLGPDTALCVGSSVVLSPSSSNVDTWLWQDGSALSTYTAIGPGTITVQVANSCATAYDTIVIDELPATPSLDIGPDTLICPGESITLSISTQGVDILWSDGSTGNQVVVTDSMNVYATISNACGDNSDTIHIGLLPETPDLYLGADQTICPGELVVYDPGIANVDYLWHDGSTNGTYQTTQGETIYLTITGVCGSSTDTVVLTESSQGPMVDLGPDVMACEGETVVIPSGIAGVMYIWQDGSTGNSLSVSQPGTYSLTVSNSCGMDADTVAVDFTPLPPVQVLGPDTAVCEGTPVILEAITSPSAQLQWQDLSTVASFTVAQAGTYYVTSFNACGMESDTIEVSYLDAPDSFSLGPDTMICAGETVLLSSPSIFYDVLWQDGSGMLHLIADHAGVYWLQLSNDCGVQSDTLVIDLDTHIPQLELPAEYALCPGDQLVLDATQTFPAIYVWSTGETTPYITVVTPGVYSVEVTAPCKTNHAETLVSQLDDCEDQPSFYMPNVFSPNGDGVNDVFTVFTNTELQVLSMESAIYDRWGNLVFQSDANPFIWDGMFNGEPVNPAVYVYRMKVTYMQQAGKTEQHLSGDITLIR